MGYSARSRKAVAALLAAALVGQAPGLSFYSAWGAVLDEVPAGERPVIAPTAPLPALTPILQTPPLAVAPEVSLGAAQTLSPATEQAQAGAPAASAAQTLSALESRAAAPAAAKAGPSAQKAALDAAFTGAKAQEGGSAGDSVAGSELDLAAGAPSAELAERGYAVAAAPAGLETLRERLSSSARTLSRDHNAPAGVTRLRAAAQIELTPSRPGEPARVRITPGATFQDDKVETRVPPISAEIARSPDFKRLVASVVSKLPAAARRDGVRVSVHQMRVEDGAVVEGLHQDDFADYVAMYAVGRENAEGGESRLFADAGGRDEVFAKRLAPGELLIVDNRKLWHDVTPIRRARPKAGKASRDVLVFAIKSLGEQKELAPGERKRLSDEIDRELSKPVPDASRLRKIYDLADARLQRGLYLGFKRWTRYFTPQGEPGLALWKSIKTASAPWAGRHYVVHLTEYVKSFSEMVAARGGKPVDAEKEAQKIHDADKAFSEAFVAAAKAAHPDEDLDAQEAAAAVSDEVIFRQFVEPVLKGAQKGKFDRAAALPEMAQRLKDSLFAYSPLTPAQIQALLARDEVKAKLGAFLDALEPYVQQADPGGGGKQETSTGKTSVAAKVNRLGTALALGFVVFSAVWQHFTGHPLVGGHETMLAMAGVVGVGNVGAPAAQTPSLPPYLVDLTQKARDGELDPVYLRDAEINATVRVLNQTKHNNVFYLGEPGVGKTTVGEGVAQLMAEKRTGTPLDEQRLLQLEIGEFLAVAAGNPDKFAQAVNALIAETADGKTVLMIDEAHQLARDPAVANLQMSFFDQLKPAMTRGKLKVILATTRAEYNKYFQHDEALESRTEVLQIEPVAEEPAVELLYSPKTRALYERGVSISYEAAEAAVRLSLRAFRFKALLRIAIKALDNAATRLRIRPAQLRTNLLSTRRSLLYKLDQLREARKAGNLKRQESLVKQLADLLKQYAADGAEYTAAARTSLGADDVATALEEMGAPLYALKGGSKEFIDGVAQTLRGNLVGHDALVDQTVAALKNRFADPTSRKPIFSAALFGPTGTGKTEYVRLLAKAIGIDDADSLIQINGGAYQDKHEIQKLIGAPPSYVGFGETDTLQDKVRRKPKRVILVDEAEKLHPDILKFFLSILEDGWVEDSRGRRVDFSNTMIVFTSNFGVPAGDYEKLSDADFRSHVEGELKKDYSPFKPEFLNRFNVREVFPTLKPEQVDAIADLRLNDLQKLYRTEHGVDVVFSDRSETKKALLAEGYSARNGARELNRALERQLKNPLSAKLVDGALRRGDRAVFAADGGLSVVEAPADVRKPALAAPGAAGDYAGKLDALISSMPSEEVLTMDKIDAALDLGLPKDRFRDLAPRAYSPDFIPDASSRPLEKHTPKRADPELDKAVEAIRAAAGEAAAAGAKALALKAKALERDAALRALEGSSWERGFADLEAAGASLSNNQKTAIQERLAAAVKKANEEGRAVLSWRRQGDELVARVETNAGLPFEEEHKLWDVVGRGQAPAEPNELSLLDLRESLAKAGGTAGYYKEDGKTILWAKWTIAPASAVEPQASTTETPEPAADPAAPAVETPAPAAEPSRASREQTLLSGLEEQSVSAARAIEADLTARPQAAAAELESALRLAINAYSAALAQRADGVIMASKDREQFNGRWAPPRRVRDAIALYEKLAGVRSDLVSPDLLSSLQVSFGAPFPIGWQDKEGDQAVAATYVQLAGVAKAVASKRLDILTTAALARLVAALRAHDEKASTDEATEDFQKASAILAELLEKSAAEASLADARAALTTFDPAQGVWVPNPRMGDLVDSLINRKPGFAAALRLAPGAALPERPTQSSLTGLAETILTGSEESAFAAARSLEKALAQDASAAAPELELTLRSGIDLFVTMLGQRKAETSGGGYYGYTYTITALKSEDRAQVDGRWVPSRRVRDLLALYQRLAAARPDLVSPELLKTLHADFTAPLVIKAGNRNDSEGDQAAAAALLELVALSKTVAAKRPDVLSVAELARLSTELSANNGLEASRFGGGAVVREAHARARAEISDLLETQAMKSPIEEVRATLTQFDVDRERWTPRRGFESLVAKHSQYRPRFAAALAAHPGQPLDGDAPAAAPAAPVAEPGAAASAAADDPLALRYHWLPPTRSWKEIRVAVLRAEDGARKYLGAYRRAGMQPVVADPAGFYADTFGLGQILWTTTEIGARISTELARRRALKIWKTYFRPEAGADSKAERQLNDFLDVAARVDADSPNRLRKEIHGTLLAASLLPVGLLAEYLSSQTARLEQAYAFRDQDAAGQALAAFTEGAKQVLAERPDGQVVGVVVTGSYVYGAPHQDSDLDVYPVTKGDPEDPAVKAEVADFIVRLEKAREPSRWPALKDIGHAQVYRRDDPAAKRLMREFPSRLVTLDEETGSLLGSVQADQPFWTSTWWQRFWHALTAPYFRRSLRGRLEGSVTSDGQAAER